MSELIGYHIGLDFVKIYDSFNSEFLTLERIIAAYFL